MLTRLARRLVPARLRPPLRRALRGVEHERFHWSAGDVVDAVGPTYNVRCYLERRAIRELLREVVPGQLPLGVEVGCGYGRMTMVLGEFCESVIGLEREESLLEIARPLLPDITFTRVESLQRLPLDDGSADLLMTFAVLQHLTDLDAQGVLREIRRAVRPGGLVLLVEKTDPTSVHGDLSDGSTFLSQGRPVETFAAWLDACKLERQVAGHVEPGYPVDRVGTHMLFRAPELHEPE